MSDFHARQLTGSTCGKYNCAAASAAMAIHAGTAGAVMISSDEARRLSGASCKPGAHSGSGGLYISDVIRVCSLFSVEIDYGRDPVHHYRRWTEAEARARLADGYVAIFLGDYDQVPSPYRAVGSTFLGDHSLVAHDLRSDLPAHGGTTPTLTVCWHDPLRPAPIRVPLWVLVAYWQKAGSPVRGYAGWVKDRRIVARKVSVRRFIPFWRYVRSGSSWSRRVLISPGGFTATCTAPEELMVLGQRRRMVRVTSGAYAGGQWSGKPDPDVPPTWLDLDAFGVTYREETP